MGRLTPGRARLRTGRAHPPASAAAADAVPARRRAVQPSTLRCGARVTPSAPAGTSLPIALPAATYAPGPISTGAISTVSLPTNAASPTVVWCLFTPS